MKLPYRLLEKRAINNMVLSSIGIKRHAAATAIQARMRGRFVRHSIAIKRHGAATAIQARMRGCFARDQAESDVHREMRSRHWGRGSSRLRVLRSNERRMGVMRQNIRLSMPITYAAANAARKRKFLRECGDVFGHAELLRAARAARV